MPYQTLDLKVARELFRTASVWRAAVIGAAVFTALAIIFPPSSPPHPRASYTPPPPLPTATPQASAAPHAPQIPTGAAQTPPAPVPVNSAPPAPVAPAVPKIQPGAQADQVANDPRQPESSGQFGEVKEGQETDRTHIKPSQSPDE